MAQAAKKQQAPVEAPVEASKAPAQTQALAPKEDNTIRGLLEKAKPKLKEVLPRHLSADRLVRVTIACINKTPTLLECTKESLLNAVMQAAQLGLEPTGVLGSAYLVPYNVKYKDADGKERWRKEAQLIPGYRGLIDLARRSGQIESIEAHVVHANDRFQCRYGLDPTLEHEPAWQGDPGPVIAAYAVAKLKDGGKQIEVMTRAQLDKIKGNTQSKGKWGPWQDHEEEMQRKTVVRRIAKYLPLTPELADALSALEDVERLDPQEVDPAPKGVDGLKSILAAKDTTVDVPHDPETGEVLDEPPADTGEVREPGSDDDDPTLPEAG
jgi:recombination protein RecT